jgi:uncharacterized membrane protein YhhN
MASILLSTLALITGGLHIRAEYAGARWQTYIFKPLTTSLILLLALLAPNPVPPFYRYAIIAGLCLSLLGDIFLMLPVDHFLHGLVSFLLAHLCYIAAFAVRTGFSTPIWTLAPFLLYGIVMVRLLWPHVGKLKLPVLVYMAVILVMGWQAFAQWQQYGSVSAFLALGGAVLFVLSDTLLALDRFRRSFWSAHALILGTYYVAQLLIALSVRSSASLPD